MMSFCWAGGMMTWSWGLGTLVLRNRQGESGGDKGSVMAVVTSKGLQGWTVGGYGPRGASRASCEEDVWGVVRRGRPNACITVCSGRPGAGRASPRELRGE